MKQPARVLGLINDVDTGLAEETREIPAALHRLEAAIAELKSRLP